MDYKNLFKIKFILLIVIMSLTTLVNAQNKYENALKMDFSKYFKQIENKNGREAMAYIDPDFFEIIPEHKLLQSVDYLNNNDVFDYNISNAKIIKMQKPIKVKDSYYSILEYSTKTTIKFKVIDLDNQDKKNVILKSFGDKKDEITVNYNEITDNFDFLENKKLCAVSKDKKNTWKFIYVDEKNKGYLSKILPQQVINEL